MINQTDETEQKLPIFKIVNGELVRKPNDSRDPNRRYSQVVGPDGNYLREFTNEEERQREEEEARWIAEAPQRAQEEERQKVEAEIFRASLKYEKRLIAFIDILGWTEAVRAAPGNFEKTQKLGLALNTIRGQVLNSENMSKLGGDDGRPGDPKVTQFSDCLTISALDDYAGKTAIISTLNILSMSLLHQGFLLRGGIAVGDIYHRESMVFGPAFLKAYDLESRCSIYPRIILDPLLSKLWGQGDAYLEKDGSLIDYARTWRLSNDGFRFFDFLQPFGGSPSFWNSTSLIRNSLEPLRSLIIDNLKLHVDNTGVRAKYVWLANYFNDVCSEYEGHGVELITTE